MENTIFLAQMWGPALMAVGLGFFVSKKYYVKIYRDLEKETLALLMFGMAGIAVGIAQIQYHNSWNTFPEMFVSFLGWGTLLKGILFAVAPGFVDRAGDWEVKSKLVPLAGSLVLLGGLYLSYFAYLS